MPRHRAAPTPGWLALLAAGALLAACGSSPSPPGPSSASTAPPGATSPPAAVLPSAPSPAPVSSGAPAAPAPGASPRPVAPPAPPAAPAPAPAPPPPTFGPQASGTGTNPGTHVLVGDLTLTAGRQVVVGFTVTAAGAVSLHAGAETGSSYPVASLQACLEYAGEAPCAPRSFPDPGYWTITAADLAAHGAYQLRLLATASGGPSALVYLDAGWNGPARVTFANLTLPGGCAAASTGYVAGCGVRYRLAENAGTENVATAPGATLHLKIKDKASGAVTFDHAFSGSVAAPIASATTWTHYLYPETGTAVALATLTVTWP